ncbi:MAG TPA: hypothetical protein VGB76_16330 [Pyrinomonadaceae bacterium]|jgi:hypothetical protein
MKLSRILFLLLLGCILSEIETGAQATKPVRPPGRGGMWKSRLGCAPRKLFRGDSLRLTMSVPHGGDLAIVAPGDGYFLLSFWQPDKTDARQSLFDWEAFKSRRQLTLDTARLKAKPWVAGRDEPEPVFSRTGWYRVRLSENLETDDGTPVSECRVYYVNAKRR